MMKQFSGMIVTLIIMAVFIILALVFCVVYYYRKLVAKWNYWDDPENDTWRQEMGQEQVSPAPQWKSLLAEGTIQNLSRVREEGGGGNILLKMLKNVHIYKTSAQKIHQTKMESF